MLTKVIYYTTLKTLIKTLWLNTLNHLDYVRQSKKGLFPGIRLNSKRQNAFKNCLNNIKSPKKKRIHHAIMNLWKKIYYHHRCMFTEIVNVFDTEILTSYSETQRQNIKCTSFEILLARKLI